MMTLFMAIALATAPTAKPPAFRPSGEPVPATQDELAAIRTALDDKLADAESARFKDFRVRHSTPPDADRSADACGTVNAKNQFGAYVGYRKYYAVLYVKGGKQMAMILGQPDDFAKELCAQQGM